MIERSGRHNSGQRHWHRKGRLHADTQGAAGTRQWQIESAAKCGAAQAQQAFRPRQGDVTAKR